MPKHRKLRGEVGLLRKKSARSTDPLRRLAVRGCERTMRSIDEAKRNLRSGFPYCGYQESLPQYRVVRWFLLPEAELAGGWQQIARAL